DRLGELTRQLGTDGQIEGRIELLEETLGTRLGAIEKVVRAELDTRLGALADRLGQVEQSLVGDDTATKLLALESTVRRRLTNLEDAVRSDDIPDRLGRLERALAEALGGGDGGAVGHDPALGSRFDALERSLAWRSRCRTTTSSAGWRRSRRRSPTGWATWRTPFARRRSAGG